MTYHKVSFLQKSPKEWFVMDDLKREASKHFAEGLKLNKDNYIFGTEPHG